MKFDFVEIGTSDFDSLSQTAGPQTRGISVEPIRYYLDRLPDLPGVRKICAAVGTAGGTAEVFYVPDHVIQQQGLPFWMRGCNCVGDYHLQHRLFSIEHLVQVETVPQISLTQIMIDNSVTDLDLLKLDTEGHDCGILRDFWPWAEHNLLPRRIQFESNQLTPAAMVLEVTDLYRARYAMIHQDSDNTVLELI